jgi:hypothetical protein
VVRGAVGLVVVVRAVVVVMGGTMGLAGDLDFIVSMVDLDDLASGDGLDEAFDMVLSRVGYCGDKAENGEK